MNGYGAIHPADLKNRFDDMTKNMTKAYQKPHAGADPCVTPPRPHKVSALKSAGATPPKPAGATPPKPAGATPLKPAGATPLKPIRPGGVPPAKATPPAKKTDAPADLPDVAVESDAETPRMAPPAAAAPEIELKPVPQIEMEMPKELAMGLYDFMKPIVEEYKLALYNAKNVKAYQARMKRIIALDPTLCLEYEESTDTTKVVINDFIKVMELVHKINKHTEGVFSFVQKDGQYVYDARRRDQRVKMVGPTNNIMDVLVERFEPDIIDTVRFARKKSVSWPLSPEFEELMKRQAVEGQKALEIERQEFKKKEKAYKKERAYLMSLLSDKNVDINEEEMKRYVENGDEISDDDAAGAEEEEEENDEDEEDEGANKRKADGEDGGEEPAAKRHRGQME